MDWPSEGLANELSIFCCLNKIPKHSLHTYVGKSLTTKGYVITERVKMSFVSETDSKIVRHIDESKFNKEFSDKKT